MYSLVFTTRMKKDLKLMKKRGKDINKLENILNILLSGEELALELSTKGFQISSRTIYSYELGQRQPNSAFLQALTKYYGINAEWLLNGFGDMYSSQNSYSASDCDFSNVIFIPLIDLSVSAGYGTLIEERAKTKDFIAFAKSWLTNITVTSPEHLILFTVKGDSMKGEFDDGDMVLINDLNNELNNDGTYVVSIDDKLYVKILQRFPGNKVQIISKNSKYKPYTIDLNTEQFNIVGKVIWSGVRTYI